MRAVAPFLVVPHALVGFGAWELKIGGEWKLLPEVLPEWDYNTDLHLRRTVNLDLTSALKAIGLPANASLGWLVSWRATDSKLAGSASRRPVADGSMLISVVVPGGELGAALDLFTRLVLVTETDSGSPGAARHAGSIVAEHVQRVVLQGDLGQFPVALIDFAASGLDADASFVVEIVDDPCAPVLSGIQLLINSRDTRLIDAVSGRDTTAAAAELVAMMEEEVAGQVLDHVVRHADDFGGDAWDDDTIGQVGLELVRRIEAVPGLRALAELREANVVAYRALLVGEARRNGLGRRIAP